jgi:hypothetical protein
MSGSVGLSAYFPLTIVRVRVRVRVTLQLAVYRQSLHLGDKPLETHDRNFYFPNEHLQL